MDLKNQVPVNNRFGGGILIAGLGETVFILLGVRHAEITYHTPKMTYLRIRTVEPEGEPCCCGEERPSPASLTLLFLGPSPVISYERGNPSRPQVIDGMGAKGMKNGILKHL